jgi:hypothetical protein
LAVAAGLAGASLERGSHMKSRQTGDYRRITKSAGVKVI